jgi:hypothetical protein
MLNAAGTVSAGPRGRTMVVCPPSEPRTPAPAQRPAKIVGGPAQNAIECDHK